MFPTKPPRDFVQVQQSEESRMAEGGFRRRQSAVHRQQANAICTWATATSMHCETHTTTCPDQCDFVMYWWHQGCADLDRNEQVRRFGFITTNSITQTFNRQVVEVDLDERPASFDCLRNPGSSVGRHSGRRSGSNRDDSGSQGKTDGLLGLVVERRSTDDDECDSRSTFTYRRAGFNADLTIGADVACDCALDSKSRTLVSRSDTVGKGFRT